MIETLRRHFFMALAAFGLIVMAGFLAFRLLAGPAEGASAQPGGGGPPSKAGGQGPGGGGGGGGRPQPVFTEAVATRSVSDRVEAVGSVLANESVSISAKVQDVIDEVRFDSGQFVRRGDVLVVLASTEQAADVTAARSDLAGAQEDVAVARSQLAEAEASAAESRLALRRAEDLAAKGFAAPARVDQARAADAAGQARVAAARQRVEALLNRVGAVQARAAAAGSRAGDRVIRAPFSGVVGLRNISPGQLARPGDVLVTLDDVSVVKVDFAAPESAMGLARPGAVARLTAGSLAEPIVARIASVDTRIDPRTRTFIARALVENTDGSLKPGMQVTATIEGPSRTVVAVPDIAVQEEGDASFVFVVPPAKGEAPAKAERRAIQVGQRRDGFVEVTAGLKPGDQIITEGLVRLRPGQPVRIANAGQERPAGAGRAATGGPPPRAGG
jgi:membrane fusion protein, multidrug efflux system